MDSNFKALICQNIPINEIRITKKFIPSAWYSRTKANKSLSIETNLAHVVMN